MTCHPLRNAELLVSLMTYTVNVLFLDLLLTMLKLETVSIAEPLQNRQHAQIPNAVNTRE